MPVATAAFSSRAPSRCSFRSSSRAVVDDVVDLLEPPAAPAGASCACSRRRRAACAPCASTCGRASARGRRRRRSARASRADRPRRRGPLWTAGPPCSESRMCAFSSASSSSPGSREDPARDLVRHARRRQVDRLLLAEELGGAPLELEHGRVLALLLVADLGARHRVAHRRATASSRYRSEDRSREESSVDHLCNRFCYTLRRDRRPLRRSASPAATTPRPRRSGTALADLDRWLAPPRGRDGPHARAGAAARARLAPGRRAAVRGRRRAPGRRRARRSWCVEHPQIEATRRHALPRAGRRALEQVRGAR